MTLIVRQCCLSRVAPVVNKYFRCSPEMLSGRFAVDQRRLMVDCQDQLLVGWCSLKLLVEQNLRHVLCFVWY